MALIGIIGGLTFVTIAFMVVLMRLVLSGGEAAQGAISAVYGAWKLFVWMVFLYLFGNGIASTLIGAIEWVL